MVSLEALDFFCISGVLYISKILYRDVDVFLIEGKLSNWF